MFVEDLSDAKRFDQEVFGLPVAFEDDASTVFRFENTLINLLKFQRLRSSSGPPGWLPRRQVPGCS